MLTPSSKIPVKYKSVKRKGCETGSRQKSEEAEMEESADGATLRPVLVEMKA